MDQESIEMINAYRWLRGVCQGVESSLNCSGFEDDFYDELKGYAHLSGFATKSAMYDWALPLCAESLRQWQANEDA